MAVSAHFACHLFSSSNDSAKAAKQWLQKYNNLMYYLTRRICTIEERVLCKNKTLQVRQTFTCHPPSFLQCAPRVTWDALLTKYCFPSGVNASAICFTSTICLTSQSFNRKNVQEIKGTLVFKITNSNNYREKLILVFTDIISFCYSLHRKRLVEVKMFL